MLSEAKHLDLFGRGSRFPCSDEFSRDLWEVPKYGPHAC